MTNVAAVNTNYRDIGPTTLAVWQSEFDRVNSPLQSYEVDMFNIASEHSALCLAMMWIENQYSTTGNIIQPGDHNPLGLRPWIGDPNPPDGVSHIITAPDGGQFYAFDAPTYCIQEWRRRLFDDPGYKNGNYVGLNTLYEMIEHPTRGYAPPGDVHPVTGVDNKDIGYTKAVTNMLMKFASMEEGIGPGPAMRAWDFPGAPRSMYLPEWSDVSVLVRIVNHSNVRSGRKYGPKTSDTYHDTGNPRTTAVGEYNWLAAGRPGGGAGGYTGIMDDLWVYITGRFDEETWHAGVTQGNRYSTGYEHAFGGRVNWNRSVDVACAVHGGTLEMLGLDPDDDFVWHRYWYGKYCPAQIFNRNMENFVRQKVKEFYNMAAAARAGTALPPPSQEFVDPVPPMVDGQIWDGLTDVIINGVKFEAQKLTAQVTVSKLQERQWANTESLFTGPGKNLGESVNILGWVVGELVQGISEWAVTEDGTRMWSGGLNFEPKEDPEYGSNPEDVDGLIGVNGRLYYPMYPDADDETDDQAETRTIGRHITIHRSGNLHKWADTSSEIVGTVEPYDSTAEEIADAIGGILDDAEESRTTEGDGDGPEDGGMVFKYWTRGEEIPLQLEDGSWAPENIWFAEDLYTGARMWAGLSNERPS